MKKLILVALLMTNVAHAKKLTVDCKGDDVNVIVTGQVANISSPLVVDSVSVNDFEESFRTSDAPIFIDKNPDGNIAFRMSVGDRKRSLDSQTGFDSITFSLNKCTDSFSANGSATYNEYVGGFLGSKQHSMECTCSLD